MTFIVVLLFLLAVRYWWGELPSIAGSYPAKWFGWINSSLSGTAAYLASVVLPALLLAWVSNGFDSILFGLPAFMLHLGVLLFVLHAPSPEMTFDALQLEARQSTTEDGLLADTQGQTLRSLLSNLHQGFFVYIVWYLLLGPGAPCFVSFSVITSAKMTTARQTLIRWAKRPQSSPRRFRAGWLG